MKRNAYKLMGTIFASVILLVFTYPAFSQTYSERVVRYNYFKSAYKKDDLFYHVPDKWIKEHGYSKVRKKWSHYLVLNGKTIIRTDRRKYAMSLKKRYPDYKQRYARRSRESKILRRDVYQWLIRERKELLALQAQRRSLREQNTQGKTTPQNSPKNTVYIPGVNKYIERGASYVFHFESANGKHKWIKRAASTRDIPLLVPSWVRGMQIGDKITSVEIENPGKKNKVLNNFWVKTGQ